MNMKAQHGSAKEALEWMRSLAEDPDSRVLFRGQSRVYPTIKPSITRDCEETRRCFWAILRLFCSHRAMHLTGYAVGSVHDRLSILQHYIGRSAVVDLTGKPEVALYFALMGKCGEDRVVYVVDQTKSAPSGVVFSNHAFLALPLGQGGDKHRWLRQDGYSVGPTDWWDRDVVQNFDLLKLDGVSCMRFTKEESDDRLVEGLGNLESVEDDPLAYRVRGNVQQLARTFGLMSSCVEAVLSASSTGDPDDFLRSEITRLTASGEQLRAPQSVQGQLRELKAALEGGFWDTSFDAGLWWAEDRLASD